MSLKRTDSHGSCPAAAAAETAAAAAEPAAGADMTPTAAAAAADAVGACSRDRTAPSLRRRSPLFCLIRTVYASTGKAIAPTRRDEEGAGEERSTQQSEQTTAKQALATRTF